MRSLTALGATPLPPTVPEASLESEVELAPPPPTVPAPLVALDVVLLDAVPPTPEVVPVVVLVPLVALLVPVVVPGLPVVELPVVWLAVVEETPPESGAPPEVPSSAGASLLHAVRVARLTRVKEVSEKVRSMTKLPFGKSAAHAG